MTLTDVGDDCALERGLHLRDDLCTIRLDPLPRRSELILNLTSIPNLTKLSSQNGAAQSSAQACYRTISRSGSAGSGAVSTRFAIGQVVVK